MNIADKLVRERRARLAAERLLEQKSRELVAANGRLAEHARSLSDLVDGQRQDLHAARSRAAALQGRNNEIESDLERALAAARQAQRRLWQALETMRDGFAVFDGDQKLIIANGAFVALFQGRFALRAGQTYDEVVRAFARDGIIDLDGCDEHDWHHEMAARLLQPEIAPRVVRLADGRFLRLSDRRGEGGDLVCLATDISESMAREAELEEARTRAEAASRAKSAFLANMSHEIRTPMNGVVGMADLLCATDLTEEQRLFAETIRTSGEALLTIINDVLDYSKAEAEKLRLCPQPFDLERCLHEVMLLLSPRAREKGISLAVDFDLFLPTRFVADPGRMRQVLTNLLGNAVKFTAAGHVLARVVGLERGDGRFDMHFSIEDTGIGIAAEDLDRIFAEFSQVEDQSDRKYEGTGLGLAITRQLVALMGGEIWVDSEPGRGSCFGFRITLAPAEPVAAEGSDCPVALKRAVIADGALVSRSILARQLETIGLQVRALRSGAEAAGHLAGGAICDLLIIDLDGEGGGSTVADLVVRLRALRPEAALLVAGTSPPLVPPGEDLTDGFLQKPILRSDLFRKLQDLSRGLAAAGGQPAAPPAAGRLRVLAADDNRTNRLVFRKMVEGLDIDLAFAASGREAVDLWERLRPDLIYMDISMPEMDGRQAAQAIRAREAAEGLGAHVPMIAMTAHALEGDAERILSAGLDRYLAKPLKRAEVARPIEELLAAVAPIGPPVDPPLNPPGG
ncbi:MAG: response regulator [Proteobacteria bacterium]|nr:response regulator [Pseudomonadota bacterium]